VRIAPLPHQRRHTLYFLGELGRCAPVFLDTEVDMSQVCEHRSEARAHRRRYSVVSYVLLAATRALLAHPEANTAVRGRRVARFDAVHGKLALDKTVGGHRVVVSAVLRDLQSADLDAIQSQVDHYRDSSPETAPEFTGMRLLHRLPPPVGRLMFRLGVRPLSRRAEVMGTFALSSLGHRPVDGFHSQGGTTITLGVGQVADRPVVRDGTISVAPTMRLSMTFDHRAIDGALAADLLTDIAQELQDFRRRSSARSDGEHGHQTAGPPAESTAR
jgi:pyruvate/2-oxoglutarate dehydrogenase complex dihydrolipoamide acyltransferase (E2) component